MTIGTHKKQLTSNKFFGICVLVFICILFFGSWNLPAAHAACEPIYGGGPTCTNSPLSIQSQVLNTNTNRFVHDLGAGDQFQSNDLITFQITLTNNGNAPVQHIIIKDTFPSVVQFTDGPGQFNKSNNTLTFTVSNLAAHHSQLFTLSGRITSQDNFPQNNACVSNEVSALAATGNVVKDSSQFCLGTLTSTPATGPEALGLLALIPTAAAGIFLTTHKRFQI